MGLYDEQATSSRDARAQGKTQAAIVQKYVETFTKAGMDPDVALAKSLKMALGAQREQKANGGVVGYAEGGDVAPMSRADRLLAEMEAKYGKAPSNSPTPQAPAPVPQVQPQQSQGFFGRAGLPAGAPGMVAYEPGGVQRRSIGGIDHITDPNAPGGANYQLAPPSGLDASGGYGTYSGSGQARGVTPWDQTPGGQNGFAFGGAVPPQDVPGGHAVAQAVAGRQVFGQSDGSGTDDALPAVIDGERPAALTSGEFVWPVKAVQFYGMDRLNKMLAAAEKGMAPQGNTA